MRTRSGLILALVGCLAGLMAGLTCPHGAVPLEAR